MKKTVTIFLIFSVFSSYAQEANQDAIDFILNSFNKYGIKPDDGLRSTLNIRECQIIYTRISKVTYVEPVKEIVNKKKSNKVNYSTIERAYYDSTIQTLNLKDIIIKENRFYLLDNKQLSMKKFIKVLDGKSEFIQSDLISIDRTNNRGSDAMKDFFVYYHFKNHANKEKTNSWDEEETVYFSKDGMIALPNMFYDHQNLEYKNMNYEDRLKKAFVDLIKSCGGGRVKIDPNEKY